jgi:hypothetical protein
MVKSEYLIRRLVFQQGRLLCLRLHKQCNTKFRLILNHVKAQARKKN